MVPPVGGNKVFVTESLIQEIHSQTLIHPTTKQVIVNETLTHSLKRFFNYFVQINIFLSKPLVNYMLCCLDIFVLNE